MVAGVKLEDDDAWSQLPEQLPPPIVADSVKLVGWPRLVNCTSCAGGANWLVSKLNTSAGGPATSVDTLPTVSVTVMDSVY